MDLCSCCGSGSRSSSDTIRLGGHQPSYSSSSSATSSSSIVPSGRSRKPVKWRGIWMRLLKEKRGSTDQPQVPSYDSYTYSQNFDQGAARDEPENISRSFSVRFADPALSSRAYGKNKSGKKMTSIVEAG
ncbi:hypothetical protein MLD38_005727 [Melastoma candidum]|uniref:Uncharacterized protein n=1 Tax=Melastoma candidum TaxID=119954 RepID=A0ACB9RKC8_9MYRT|nr:hypothetical protein MLD38_005727 [Melastoma candidum]